MNNEELIKRLLAVIPQDSIGRYDLFPVFRDVDLFTDIIKNLSASYIGKVDYVAAPEAIGWIIGSAMARELNVGFIPLRKIDKLPYRKESLISQNYDGEYGVSRKALEIRKGFLANGSKILVVDEWVETGLSLLCCMKLLEKLGCKIIGLATIGIDYRDGTKDWIDTGFIQYIGKDI